MKRKSFLILIDGPIGSGKSTTAKMLQMELYKKKRLSALISLDSLKRIVYGYKIDNKAYVELASNIGIAMAKEYLKRNMNVIVEKAFTREEFVNSFIKPLRKMTKILIYQLEAPFGLRVKRINKRELKRKDKKKLPVSKIKRNTKHYDKSKYREATIFDTSIP
ncbi:AAA family ATPase [Candidatus Pacearchaeota archaeon]|nr:AAA family ATPase [Candidatus Pacearchaeota archaeon]